MLNLGKKSMSGFMGLKTIIATGALLVTFATSGSALAGCRVAENSPELVRQVTMLTNQFRNTHSLGDVRPSAKLSNAAAAHACDMAVNNFFGHVSSNGGNIKARTNRAGYKSCMVAENIAWGYDGAGVVVQGWEQSAGHRANMLHRKAREIGFAVAYRDNTPYWVMVLGSPC
jgi:uncharacterized protein YkwD